MQFNYILLKAYDTKFPCLEKKLKVSFFSVIAIISF